MEAAGAAGGGVDGGAVAAPTDAPEAQTEKPPTEPLSARLVAWTARDLVQALAYLHLRPGGDARQHGDVKPGNVLYSAHGRALLADFGSSRLAVRIASESSGRSALTGATPAFAAQEMLLDAEAASPAGDVWSLGATLLCLLTGHELAEAADVRRLLQIAAEPLWTLERHVARTLELPLMGGKRKALPHAGLSDAERARWEAAPEGLRAFIARCLVVDADARPTAAKLCGDDFIATVEAVFSPREATPAPVGAEAAAVAELEGHNVAPVRAVAPSSAVMLRENPGGPDVALAAARAPAAAAAVAELEGRDVTPARAVALLRDYPGDPDVALAAAQALAAAADMGEGDQGLVYSAGRRACVDAGAPAALVALAGTEAVKHDTEVARIVALAMRNLSRANEGKSALLEEGAAQAVVVLAGEGVVKGSAGAAQFVAEAMASLSDIAGGQAMLLASGAAPALVALAGEGVVKRSAGAVQYVANAVANLGGSDDGQTKLLACGAAPTLVALADEDVVKGSAGAAEQVARAMANLGACLEGRDKLLARGAAPALVALARRSGLRGPWSTSVSATTASCSRAEQRPRSWRSRARTSSRATPARRGMSRWPWPALKTGSICVW